MNALAEHTEIHKIIISIWNKKLPERWKEGDEAELLTEFYPTCC
jgi:hypothetical protein